VHGRGTLVWAAVIAAAVAASVVRASPSAPPLVQVTPHELRLSQPLVGLAAEGRRAAFAFCNQLVGTWRPGAANVTRLGLPVAQWTCPPPRGLEHIYGLACAGDRVAWTDSGGGNSYFNLVFLVVLSHPHTWTVAAETSYCCRPLEPDPNRMGDLFGAGGLIVFSSRVKCGDLGAPSCPGPTRTVVSQTMWKLRRPPFTAQCVNKPGPCVQLTTSAPNATLRPLSVSSGRILLLNNGVLELRNAAGAITRQFGGVAAVMRGADLMGNRVLVLVPAKLRVYNASTGALVRTRPLPNVTSAGVCGMPPCPVAALQMLDAARGLVAYTLSGKLHLLRLRDGRNRVVAAAEDARFGSKGLFYAYSAAAPWVSRIRFVPWAALPVRP
jgi:hypothetical protein